MKFADPIWLMIGLAACGLLAWLFHRHDRRQRAALAAFASQHLLEKLTASISLARRKLKRGLLLFGLGCLFVALARPQAGYLWQETRQRSVDILFAVDTSKSMLTQDVKPDRLTRAKMAVDDLADRLDGDRLGLVAFAGEAFLECPLTLDGDAFRQSVDALDTSTIPRGGTDISSAIRQAQEAFHAEAGSTKLLVLMTDGEELAGSAIDAAKEAAKDGLKIDTIGIGTPEGDLIPVPNDAGGTDFVHDVAGQIVKSRLDESRLREIAEATGGTYRPLGQRGEGMTQLYEQELASLSHDQEATRKVRVPLEQFQWPLALGLLALLIEPLIGTRRSRKETRSSATMEPPRKRWLPRSRQGGLAAPPATALLLCFSLAILSPLRASPEAGEEAFQKGDYAKAEQEFEKAAQKAPQPELQLDLGSAAYKNNQYDKAGEAYQKTLQTDQLSVQQQAYYNLGDTLYRVGQQTEKSDTKQTIQAWQQAIQSYENALKLKPDDADAKFNRDFVKRKLDELQKKPPQNQGGQNNKNDQNKDQQQQNQNQSQNAQNSQDNSKSNSNQSQNQSQSQQNQNQNQNPSQQPNPSQGNPQQNQDQNQNPTGQSGQNSQPSPQQQQPQQGGNGQNQNQPQSQPPSPNSQNSSPSQAGDKQPQPQQSNNQGQPQSTPVEPGQMTPEEAKNLLNSVRGDEKILPQNQKGSGAEQPPEKDW